MKSTLTAVVALALVSPVSAQSPVRLWNDCVKTEIEERLVAQQPVRLSAERISLEGNTLRLSGNASISFEGTRVKAEEIAIDQASKHVAFTTVRNILIGSGSRCAPPPSSLPRIEYR